MCYLAECGRSALNNVATSRGEKLGSAGAHPHCSGAGLIPQKYTHPVCVILSNLVILGQTVQLNEGDPS